MEHHYNLAIILFFVSAQGKLGLRHGSSLDLDRPWVPDSGPLDLSKQDLESVSLLRHGDNFPYLTDSKQLLNLNISVQCVKDYNRVIAGINNSERFATERKYPEYWQ